MVRWPPSDTLKPPPQAAPGPHGAWVAPHWEQLWGRGQCRVMCRAMASKQRATPVTMQLLKIYSKTLALGIIKNCKTFKIQAEKSIILPKMANFSRWRWRWSTRGRPRRILMWLRTCGGRVISSRWSATPTSLSYWTSWRRKTATTSWWSCALVGTWWTAFTTRSAWMRGRPRNTSDSWCWPWSTYTERV